MALDDSGKRPTWPVVAERRAKRQKAFLAAYRHTGVISAACRAAGISQESYRLWMGDPAFASRADAAFEAAIDAIELAARERAVDGVMDYVVSAGQLVKGPDGEPLTRRIYSDAMATLLLKGRRYKVFGDKRQVELTGRNGGPIEVDLVLGKIESELARIEGRGSPVADPARLITAGA